MAYHEAFWVVVGTAAPVIELALVVTASQARTAYREAAKVHRLPLPERKLRGLWIDEKPYPETRFARAAIAWFTYASSAQIAAFGFALASLASEADVLSAGVGLLLAAFGIFAVLPAGMNVVRQQEENRRPTAPIDPVGRGPDDGGFYLTSEVPGEILERGQVIRRRHAAAAWMRRWRAQIGRVRKALFRPRPPMLRP